MSKTDHKLSTRIESNETAIKVALIDYLVSKISADSFITKELPYSFNRRRADLVVVGEQLVAFEIKSDIDNLDKLCEQIDSYNKSFHSTYIVTTEKHLNSVRKKSPSNVGIYIFKSGSINKIRKPSKRKRLDKRNLMSMIDRNVIEKNIVSRHIKHSNLKAMYMEELYELATSILNQREIEIIVRNTLSQKYLEGYSLFISERGEKTLEDDLPLLGKARNII